MHADCFDFDVANSDFKVLSSCLYGFPVFRPVASIKDMQTALTLSRLIQTLTVIKDMQTALTLSRLIQTLTVIKDMQIAFTLSRLIQPLTVILLITDLPVYHPWKAHVHPFSAAPKACSLCL